MINYAVGIMAHLNFFNVFVFLRLFYAFGPLSRIKIVLRQLLFALFDIKSVEQRINYSIFVHSNFLDFRAHSSGIAKSLSISVSLFVDS